MTLQNTDPQIAQALQQELVRQRNGLEMIPSENLTSIEVMQAQGSIATNKYAEGYPGKRYYGGNEFIDVIEQLAIDRACSLFGAEHANVQPHSGSSANMAALWTLLKPGETIMGMRLDQGGHLTHGYPLNFSGKLYNSVQYGVSKKDHLIDYDELLALARTHKPKVIIAGITAYTRELDFVKFKAIADDVGAYLMADIAHISGLIAAGEHQSPIPYCDITTSTTHKTLRGPRGGIILCNKALGNKIDKAIIPGLQGGPLEHVIAAKAVAFKEAATPQFKEYIIQVKKNAQALASALVGKGHLLITGGTDNHMLLVDVRPLNIDGATAEHTLDAAGIYCNKNTVPFDTGSPLKPSGIRLGTPAITTRGMKEKDMEQVAAWIDRALRGEDVGKIKQEILTFCEQFPLYPELTTPFATH